MATPNTTDGPWEQMPDVLAAEVTVLIPGGPTAYGVSH